MLKKWWFYLIIAGIVIIIIIPVTTISRLNNSLYNLTYNYVKLENPLNEIAKKYTYYEAETKTVEVEINQDIINSLIKEQIDNLDLALPDKLSIQEFAFSTSDQRIYINAKYGKLNIPLSAKINFEADDSEIKIFADSFLLGKRKAPGYITKRIPADQLSYTIKYSDLGIPQVFYIKDIQFGTGTLKIIIQLKMDNLIEMALEYRNDLLVKIHEYKSTQVDTVKAFIDKALEAGILSDKNVNDYVEQFLSNRELVNSTLQFAAANDLDKYSKGMEEYGQSLAEWAEPLKAVKYYGSVEDTIDNILYDQDLREMLTWFIPPESLEAYVNVADTYYSTYKEAKDSLVSLGTSVGEGKIDTAVNQIITDQELYNLMTMIFPEQEVDYYLNTTNTYYTAYKNAEHSFTSLSSSLEAGKLDAAVEQILKDKELYKVITMIFPEQEVNYYLNTTREYLSLYENVKAGLESTIESIPSEKVDKFVNDIINYSNNAEEGREILIEAISGIDTQKIQKAFKLLEEDGDILKGIDPEMYNEFKAYIYGLGETKQYLYDSLQNVDMNAIAEATGIVNDINDDIQFVIMLLKQQEYEKVGNIIKNDSIRTYEAKAFIAKYQ